MRGDSVRRLVSRLQPVIAIATVAFAAAGGSAFAAAQGGAGARPPADPTDVESVEAIVHAVYDVISGPVGQRRDVDRWISLFVSDARLVPTSRGDAGSVVLQTWTPQQFADNVIPRFERDGFFEREVARQTERFGSIAHAFSTYESRRALQDPDPYARGINSFQLLHDGSRWWIVSIFWSGEREDLPIPKKYLP